MSRAGSEREPILMSESKTSAQHERREKVLREELESRLELLEESDESIFGAFTTLDWVLCTILFFFLPLLMLVLVAL